MIDLHKKWLRNVVVIIPGIVLALTLALSGRILADRIGESMMGFERSPISPIMMAILLGILIRNIFPLSARFQPGIRFGLKRVLRLGIVLLGIRLSLGELGAISVRSLPIIIGCVATALIAVSIFGRKMGISRRLATLIAVGTSVCGTTAIVATAPSIGAQDDEVAYSIACVTLFGVFAMLAYPFVAHWMFSGDTLRIGLFLGTSVHETAQVAGAGLVYQQYYQEPTVLNIATVAKLVRNLGMLIIIPLMCVVYHRRSETAEAPRWYSMIPLFILGFAGMSLLRTIGDSGVVPFGFLDPEIWQYIVTNTKATAELSLAIAMAAVGLGTEIRELKSIGIRPLVVGLFSAMLVGCVSVVLVLVFS